MLTHNLSWLHHISEVVLSTLAIEPGLVQTIFTTLLDGSYGLIAGLIVAALLHLIPSKKAE